jgi:hypothetical protein
MIRGLWTRIASKENMSHKENSMSARRFGVALAVIGLILTFYSGYCWINRFPSLVNELEKLTRENPVAVVMVKLSGASISINSYTECAYSVSVFCQAADEYRLSGENLPTYHPVAFWCGVGGLTLGLLVLISLQRRGNSPTQVVSLGGIAEGATVIAGFLTLMALGAFIVVGIPDRLAPLFQQRTELRNAPAPSGPVPSQPRSAQSDSSGLDQLLKAQGQR